MQHTALAPQQMSATLVTPWSLRAWPPLLWQAGEPARVRFHHLGTRITFTGDPLTPPAGQTIWAGSADEGEAGMAWDWVLITRGVVAMADPMSVISNLRLVSNRHVSSTRSCAPCPGRARCSAPWASARTDRGDGNTVHQAPATSAPRCAGCGRRSRCPEPPAARTRPPPAPRRPRAAPRRAARGPSAWSAPGPAPTGARAPALPG